MESSERPTGSDTALNRRATAMKRASRIRVTASASGSSASQRSSRARDAASTSSRSSRRSVAARPARPGKRTAWRPRAGRHEAGRLGVGPALALGALELGERARRRPASLRERGHGEVGGGVVERVGHDRREPVRRADRIALGQRGRRRAAERAARATSAATARRRLMAEAVTVHREREGEEGLEPPRRLDPLGRAVARGDHLVEPRGRVDELLERARVEAQALGRMLLDVVEREVGVEVGQREQVARGELAVAVASATRCSAPTARTSPSGSASRSRVK